MFKRTKYTEDEDNVIRQFYPTESPKQMEKRLNRSYKGITVRASRISVKKEKESYECVKRWNGDIFENMTEQQKYYLAGFLDADGHIGITISNSTKVNYTPIHFKIVIANTDKRVIDFIDKITNRYGKIYFQRSKNIKHKHKYSWTLCGNRKVMSFLEVIKECLIIKKEQAELLSRGYLHLSIEERDELITSIKKLNKNGRE